MKAASTVKEWVTLLESAQKTETVEGPTVMTEGAETETTEEGTTETTGTAGITSNILDVIEIVTIATMIGMVEDNDMTGIETTREIATDMKSVDIARDPILTQSPLRKAVLGVIVRKRSRKGDVNDREADEEKFGLIG